MRLPSLLLIATVFASQVIAQREGDKWEQIVLFKSTERDVERLLGKRIHPNTFEYDSDRFHIAIWYAGRGCTLNKHPLPADIVVSMLVSPKVFVKLSEFKDFDPAKFSSFRERTHGNKIYKNADGNISIETQVNSEGAEEVIYANFSPAPLDLKGLICTP